jgi:type I restriction enzyme S subunit
MSVEKLITNNLDIWTSAIKKKSASGRGSSNKFELYGIKKLRELILELAVRGNLVPQDTNDEPADMLLERIAVEKEQLIKEKEIKKQKALPPIPDAEIPFKLPLGWKWARLQDIGRDWGQKQPDVDFSYIDVASINKSLGVIREPSIMSSQDAPSRARKIVKPGTVIYSTVRPYLLNIAVVDREFEPVPIASTAFAIIAPLGGILSSFVYRYLRSPVFVKYVESVQTGVAYPAINDKQFFSGVIPIPPLEEQKRIVAKVDELMALCDQLESQTEASIEAHQALVKTLLGTLTNAKDSYELSESWQRISEYFDVLFTTEDSIDQLKQTILQLAVMGKLVKQEPNDEPASRLLERIAAEKEQLIKDKKIKKQKPLPPISDEEKPFEVPGGWDWCRGEMVAEFIDPQPSHRTPPVVTGGVPYVGYTDIDISSGINFESARKVSPSVLIEHRKRYTLNLGDFVFGKIGTLGKPFFLSEPFDYCLSANLILIQPNQNAVVPQFLATFLNSPVLYQILNDQKTNSTHGVFGIKKARLLTVPLPPINEQKRIVVKVETLMTLCDTLKGRLKDEKTIQLHLTDAIVEQIS